ncbi:MAG TPA: CPBP family intramembrane metalloprotease [bacterium]|nr:CPBP family intramembrane metalloprotease [bacterium]
MVLNESTIHFYLYGSMLFCGIAVWMARQNFKSEPQRFNNPGAQKKIIPAVFFAIMAISIAARFAGRSLESPWLERLDTIFAGIIMLNVVIAAAAVRDEPSSVGISLRGIETVIIFLVPPLSTIFFAGHMVNLKLLLGGIIPSIAITGFAIELFFRGYMQTRLESFFGPAKGLLLTAAAYSVFNVPVMWGVLDAPAMIFYMILTFIVWGCGAGLIYRFAGNIFGLAVFHIFWDTAVYVFAGLTID